MQSLGKLTRGLLIVWGVLWVASFLIALADDGALAPLRLDPAALLAGRPAALPGVLGYVLLHDPRGVLHLLVNALLFHAFAPEIERLWPGRKFAIFLATAALAGAGCTLLLAALLPSAFAVPVIGGSGLVAAVIAAQAAVYPDRIVQLIVFQCRMRSFMLGLLLLDLLGLIASLAGRPSLVAYPVHLAGFASGWLWAGGFWRLGWDPAASWRRLGARRRARRATREQRERAAEERELDRILAKIGSHGIGSLEESERAFLERRSRRKG